MYVCGPSVLAEHSYNNTGLTNFCIGKLLTKRLNEKNTVTGC
jgi:hypothetical protein